MSVLPTSFPFFKTKTAFAYSASNSSLWETTTTRRFSASLDKMSITRLEFSSSSAPVGSSQRRQYGSPTKARAIPALCLSPPLQFAATLFSVPSPSSRNPIFRALTKAFPLPIPAASKGKAMLYRRVFSSNKLKCWNTNPMPFRLKALSRDFANREYPILPKDSRPFEGTSNLAKSPNRVDFPDPLSPFIPIRPVEGKENEAEESTLNRFSPFPNHLVMPTPRNKRKKTSLPIANRRLVGPKALKVIGQWGVVVGDDLLDLRIEFVAVDHHDVPAP